MKTKLFALLLATAVLVAACTPRERTLVILSTNDMHAQIQNFPQLAAAVGACRDTTDLVLLLDAGDRWTGNTYVDMAPTPGMPIISLMNSLGYDAVTFGNHEFDHGQAHLGALVDSMQFEVVCANVQSDTCTFPQVAPYAILRRGGLKIGVVGVVTNYEGDGVRPAGKSSSYVGLRFPDPQQAALRCAEELRDKVDLLILLSHMGDDRDAELLAAGTPYDLVIGGHTHEVRDTLIGGTLLTQSGKNLRNLGVTKVRMRGRKVLAIDYELLSLQDAPADSLYGERVARYYANEELNRPVGIFATMADRTGIALWMARSIAEEAGADVGIYHIGGVRLDSIAAGGVSTAQIYNLEPFGTKIVRMTMTPEQLRRMIVAKYNEATREGHRIDLYATEPYSILVNAASGDAETVRFQTLREGRPLRVAISDYAFHNYKEIACSDTLTLAKPVAEVLMERLRSESPIRPDNTPRQREITGKND